MRNESEIIIDTLNHMSQFCDEVYIYDDASEDNTVELCKSHSIIKEIIEGKNWDVNRERAEYQNRQNILQLARKNASPEDWFIYMDADERIEFDFSKLSKLDDDISGIKMKLFDFYITEEDVDKKYYEREWMGPEYRKILFLFKNKYVQGYHIPDQRECSLSGGKIIIDGYVKHYGKSISVKQWEDTCEYYSKWFPKYSYKWEKRKGKAIHTKSDFNTELIKWEDKTNPNKIIPIN